MTGVELLCLLVLGLQVAGLLRLADDPRRRVWRFGVLVVAAWVAEVTCIRAYGFYTYDPSWAVFVDVMPLTVALIWPTVILSARDVVRALGVTDRWRPAATAALVFADAWLIEPVAVRAGLWQWHAPGIFGVPPIGVLGWAFFTGLAVTLIESNERAGRSALADAAVVVGAPLGTHALLLLAWWGGLRWVSGPMRGELDLDQR